MKRRIFSIFFALVLVLSMSLVMAVPVAATHTSTAAIAFQTVPEAASTVAGEASILDVVVTNTDVPSACGINTVKIDFSDSDFTVTGAGIDPTGWAGSLNGDVVTYTAATEADYIDPSPSSVTFSPTVTNPPIFGEATVPAVLTTDIGSKAVLEVIDKATTGWIGYVADLVGVGGNAITVEYVNPFSESSPLSVSVTDKAITVSLATDDGGVLISTASEVADAINGDGVAGALVDATADPGNLTDVVEALTVPAFTGGISPNVDKACTVTPATLKVTSIIPASFEVVAGVDNKVTAGEAFSVKITALREAGVTETKYAGAHFIDFAFVVSGTGTIPAFELITFTDGVGTTSLSNFILTDVSEAPTIKATDEQGAFGTSLAITINPIAFSKFAIVGPTEAVAGTVFTSDITVTAQNAADATVLDYTGTVSWSSTDENAELPDPYTFTTGDIGNKVFAVADFDFTLNTAGYQTITVTDAAAGVYTASEPILVFPDAAVSMVVTASPDVISEGDTATITATFLDKFGNVVWDVPTVVFVESLGLLGTAPPATPGVATTTLTSAGDVGTATIRVTLGSFDETTTVKLLPVIATGITVTVDETTILNDGVDLRTITATYLDSESAVVTAADGADYKVKFTTAPTTQSGDFTVTGGTITIDPDTGDVANTGTVSGQLTGATTDLLGDFTAELTLTTDFGLGTVIDDLVISGTITATTMTFSGTITARDYPYDSIVADTLTITAGKIDVADGGGVTTEPDLSGPGITSCDITGTMVVGVTLSAASVDPVAGVATVTLTTVADPTTVITVNALGIGGLTDTELPTITVGVGSFKIPLEKGWNLISLPLIHFDPTPTIDTVLADLNVEQVRTFESDLSEKWWIPGAEASTLSQMVDGRGYWVEMSDSASLTVTGVDFALPGGLPPTYDVVVGWNLIGFTSTTQKELLEYLGAVEATIQALYGYDADGYFIPEDIASPSTSGQGLEPGHGYWLAVNTAGTIYP